MTFEKFKTNVEHWQAERGIYEHSTALAQALKAVSEVGELADAVIKGDRDALKDAVGDVMVCLVGVAKMTGCDIGSVEKLPSAFKNDDNIQTAAAITVSHVTDVSLNVALNYSKVARSINIMHVIYWLNAIAVKSDLTLLECCESAWNEIKDRKGKMVAGGAFIKEVDA